MTELQLNEQQSEQLPKQEQGSKIILIGTFVLVSSAILLSFLPLLNRSQIEFPDRIQIGDQSSDKSEPLIVPTSIEAIAHRYSFRDFKIDLYYIGSRASGDVSGLLNQVNKLSIPKADFKIKEVPDKGFYATFKQGGQTYLSACINPQGGTTADYTQFQINRNRYNINPTQFAIYALGLADLRDKRCLWLTLSATNPDANLEKVWVESLTYWQSRFPS